MRKKLQMLLLCLFLSLSTISSIHAADELSDDQLYHVVNVASDGGYEVLKNFNSYAEAKVAHTLMKGSYNNLGITYGTSFLTIEQGVIAFDQATDCGVNIDYINDANQEKGYTNGCYGVDAAFLENNTGSGQIKFMLGGVVGWMDSSQATIYPIERVKKSSAYTVNDGLLYHHIQSNINADAYDNSIKLAAAPSYLKKDTTYYSYDGHYFYDDYKKMIADYRENTRGSSINHTTPYYNYFQYISHRSTSAYDEEALRKYFKEDLAINSTITSFYDKDNYIHDILTQSMIPDSIPAFLEYQNTYGANALLMLALSMNETASGKSLLAYTRNNLFGHAAYDSAVEENASRYQTIASSVYSHAVHYISNSYLNPDKFQYHGGFLGDKSAGMNVQYASDPYWGEKAAQYAYEIDQRLGGKDENRYSLGISNNKEVAIYPLTSASATPIYTTGKGMTFSFILLEKTTNKDGDWYMIQSDPGLSEAKERVADGSYTFTNSYGYIKADVIDTILNESKLDVKNYIDITFDANGGTFYPAKESVTLQVENGIVPAITAPTKDHALFTGWDQKLSAAKEKKTYTAEYKEVKELLLSEKPQTSYASGDILDAKGGELTISFVDGSNKKIALTSEMISGFDSSKEGTQTLTITYAGTMTSYEISISKEAEEKSKLLSSSAQELIKNYADKGELSKDAIEQLESFRKDSIKAGLNAFNSTQIRQLDRIFQQNLHPSYSVIIKDGTYDLAVSGLSLALQDDTTFINALLPKTIAIKVKNNIGKSDLALAQKTADANHVRVDASFSISGKDDFGGFQPDTELIFSIKKPEDHENRQYRIYYIEGDDVYQLPTYQTQNRIVFTSEKIGSYVIVSSTNTNLQESNDIDEVNTVATNGTNYINRFILLPAALLLLALFGFVAMRLTMKKKHLKWKKPVIRKK